MAKGHKNASNQGHVYKHDARDYTIYCAECNQPFEATRADAVYCSAKCRTHASRAPQRLANTLDYLTGLPFHLNRIAKQYKANKRVYAAFKALHSELGKMLYIFEKSSSDFELKEDL